MRNLHHKFNTVIAILTLFLRLSVCLCWCSLNCKKSLIFSSRQYWLPKGSPISWCSHTFPSAVSEGRGIKVPQVVPCVSIEQTVSISIQDFPKILERKSQKHVLWGEVFLISCFFFALLKGSLLIQSAIFSLQFYTNLYILYRFLFCKNSLQKLFKKMKTKNIKQNKNE